ncbi:hypothetical protein AVEN_66491-1 [Araneus ventricosus]|uniref:Nucleic-acid-binding protein from transposon X-element n=1 Tax=Araneus ventricosus TaxID=182803 RepID=A0A4Y2LCQ8_ARAVE|nr:hypothetical protein AVEN_66491-1 [Araneus ventricosus]
MKRCRGSRRVLVVLQCFNCNCFGHSSAGCGYSPRCLKCSGTHRTNTCPIKERIPNSRCINCGKEGPVAAYGGWEDFSKRITKSQKRIPRSFYSNMSKVQENISYSQHFKSTKNP